MFLVLFKPSIMVNKSCLLQTTFVYHYRWFKKNKKHVIVFLTFYTQATVSDNSIVIHHVLAVLKTYLFELKQMKSQHLDCLNHLHTTRHDNSTAHNA